MLCTFLLRLKFKYAFTQEYWIWSSRQVSRCLHQSHSIKPELSTLHLWYMLGQRNISPTVLGVPAKREAVWSARDCFGSYRVGHRDVVSEFDFMQIHIFHFIHGFVQGLFHTRVNGQDGCRNLQIWLQKTCKLSCGHTGLMHQVDSCPRNSWSDMGFLFGTDIEQPTLVEAMLVVAVHVWLLSAPMLDDCGRSRLLSDWPRPLLPREDPHVHRLRVWVTRGCQVGACSTYQAGSRTFQGWQFIFLEIIYAKKTDNCTQLPVHWK